MIWDSGHVLIPHCDVWTSINPQGIWCISKYSKGKQQHKRQNTNLVSGTFVLFFRDLEGWSSQQCYERASSVRIVLLWFDVSSRVYDNCVVFTGLWASHRGLLVWTTFWGRLFQGWRYCWDFLTLYFLCFILSRLHSINPTPRHIAV